MTYKTTVTWSGIDAQVESGGELKTLLYATASGTGTLTPVLCNADGILLTDEIA